MTGSTTCRAALAKMTDEELDALQLAAETAPQLSPGLLAFLAHACDWEVHRRRGRHFAMNGPHAAIGPEELDVAIAALAAVHAAFGDSERVLALLDATGDGLQGEPPAMH